MTEITPAMEDYLEEILILQEKQKNVRVKDLAVSMEVKAPSVIDALNHLKDKGLIEQEPYGSIDLTPAGKHMAREIYGRHKTLTMFFHRILDLDEAFAEKEACRIEHYLSRKTIEKMLRYAERVLTPKEQSQ